MILIFAFVRSASENLCCFFSYPFSSFDVEQTYYLQFTYTTVKKTSVQPQPSQNLIKGQLEVELPNSNIKFNHVYYFIHLCFGNDQREGFGNYVSRLSKCMEVRRELRAIYSASTDNFTSIRARGGENRMSWALMPLTNPPPRSDFVTGD
jgi:hypothetical protein